MTQETKQQEDEEDDLEILDEHKPKIKKELSLPEFTEKVQDIARVLKDGDVGRFLGIEMALDLQKDFPEDGKIQRFVQWTLNQNQSTNTQSQFPGGQQSTSNSSSSQTSSFIPSSSSTTVTSNVPRPNNSSPTQFQGIPSQANYSSADPQPGGNNTSQPQPLHPLMHLMSMGSGSFGLMGTPQGGPMSGNIGDVMGIIGGLMGGNLGGPLSGIMSHSNSSSEESTSNSTSNSLSRERKKEDSNDLPVRKKRKHADSAENVARDDGRAKKKRKKEAKKLALSEKMDIFHLARDGDFTKFKAALIAETVKETDSEGRTVLHKVIERRRAAEFRSAIIKKGGSIDKKDKKGNTALHLAAQVGSASGVRHLLALGADSSIVNKAGKTAMQVAKTQKIKEIFSKPKSEQVSGSESGSESESDKESTEDSDE